MKAFQWIEFREGEYYIRGRQSKPADEIYAMFCAEKSPAEWDILMGFSQGTMQEALEWAKKHPEMMSRVLAENSSSTED